MRQRIIETIRDYILQSPDYLKKAITENRGITVEQLTDELRKIEFHNTRRAIKEADNRRKGRWKP